MMKCCMLIEPMKMLFVRISPAQPDNTNVATILIKRKLSPSGFHQVYMQDLLNHSRPERLCHPQKHTGVKLFPPKMT